MKPDVRVEGSSNLLCSAAGAGKIGLGERGGIVFKHRSAPGHEIFFLANTSDQPVEFTASLRVNGRKPGFWNADTGIITETAAFAQREGRTFIPLRLDAAESIFVVFSDAIGAEVNGPLASNTPDFEPVASLDGPWTVRFDGQGAPAQTFFETLTDWARHPDRTIQHYSGTGVYEAEFTLQKIAKGRRTVLELGQVAVIATVIVNGREAGTVWTSPWEIDISDVVTEGVNTLQVRVANTWNNRLVADSRLPEPERSSHVSQPYRFDSAAPLDSGGLLGPVRVKLAR
jgi:hypothetical protein